MYTPSEETVNVLRQAGYDSALLASAIEEFADLQMRFSTLVDATDKGFFTHVKTKYVKESMAVDKNLNPGTSWRPGNEEIKTLEGEGYWQALINDALGDFLFRSQPPGIVISRFALFRSYLRRYFPLASAEEPADVLKWEPAPFLKKLIWQKLTIKSETYHFFLSYFRQLAVKKQVPGKLLSRSFYHFVERNQEKIADYQKSQLVHGHSYLNGNNNSRNNQQYR